MTLDELQDQAQRIPFFRFLNLSVTSRGEDLVETVMPFAERLIGNHVHRFLHGGIVASYLEATASLAVLAGLGDGEPKPINMTVDYLRPTLAKPVHGRGIIVRSGRRMASVEARAWQEDVERPVASGLFHFLLV